MKRSIEADLAEARGHLVYFQHQQAALEAAMKTMQEDARLCAKNVKMWEGRIARMEMKR